MSGVSFYESIGVMKKTLSQSFIRRVNKDIAMPFSVFDLTSYESMNSWRVTRWISFTLNLKNYPVITHSRWMEVISPSVFALRASPLNFEVPVCA